MSSRVLFLLAAQGQVVRGRPRGSWTSHQYRWSPMPLWCPGGLADWPTAAARELARRWLRAYGPATADDLRGGPAGARPRPGRVLTELKPAEVDLDGVPGIALADDLAPVPEVEPWAALLPGLDSTPMGWQQRDGSRRARPAAVRPGRQHRPDGLVGRPDRGRLGARPRR